MELVLLILGLTGLWFGTDLALDGAQDISKRMGVSEGFLGLTLLAIGTGLPELVVGLDGGMQRLQGIDASGVVMGNALGSAIAQGALVLGIAGLITFLRLPRRMIRRDGLTLLLAILLLGLLGFDGEITRAQGGALLVAYAGYFAVLLQSEKRRNGQLVIKPSDSPEMWRTVLSVVGGLGLVVFSAELVVSEAIFLSSQWGVSQTLVGIFLVGVGTSVPELALSVRAALRGQASISVGNIIGSNTFDLLVPVGASAVIYPLAVEPLAVRFDLPVMAVITIATMVFFTRKKGLRRSEAMVLIAMYFLFVGLRIWVL